MQVLHLEFRQNLSNSERSEILSNNLVNGYVPYLQIQAQLAAEVLRGENSYLQFVDAAQVQAANKGAVFELTNTIDSPWFLSHQDRVVPTGLSRRSTSTNDVIVDDDGKPHLIKMVGFEALPVVENEFDVCSNHEQALVFASRPVGR